VLDQIRSSRLYTRVRRHEAFGQFVRYALVGSTNVAVHLIFFNILSALGLHTLGANAIAFLLATVNSFFLNKVWAFRDPRREAIFKQYVLFLSFTVVGLALHTAAFSFLLVPLDDHGTLGKNVALVCALPVSVVWNFMCYRLWTFKPRST
jgi:putative flippase GtrA